MSRRRAGTGSTSDPAEQERRSHLQEQQRRAWIEHVSGLADVRQAVEAMPGGDAPEELLARAVDEAIDRGRRLRAWYVRLGDRDERGDALQVLPDEREVVEVALVQGVVAAIRREAHIRSSIDRLRELRHIRREIQTAPDGEAVQAMLASAVAEAIRGRTGRGLIQQLSSAHHQFRAALVRRRALPAAEPDERGRIERMVWAMMAVASALGVRAEFGPDGGPSSRLEASCQEIAVPIAVRRLPSREELHLAADLLIDELQVSGALLRPSKLVDVGRPRKVHGLSGREGFALFVAGVRDRRYGVSAPWSRGLDLGLRPKLPAVIDAVCGPVDWDDPDGHARFMIACASCVNACLLRDRADADGGELLMLPARLARLRARLAGWAAAGGAGAERLDAPDAKLLAWLVETMRTPSRGAASSRVSAWRDTVRSSLNPGEARAAKAIARLCARLTAARRRATGLELGPDELSRLWELVELLVDGPRTARDSSKIFGWTMAVHPALVTRRHPAPVNPSAAAHLVDAERADDLTNAFNRALALGLNSLRGEVNARVRELISSLAAPMEQNVGHNCLEPGPPGEERKRQ